MTTKLDFVPSDLLIGASKNANEQIAEVDEVTELVNAMSINNQTDLESAVQVAAVLMDANDELEDKRKEWTAPLNAVVSSINEAFSPVLEKISSATKAIKQKINKAVKDADDEGNQLLEQVANATPEQRELILKRVEEISFEKTKGLSFRHNTSPKITDETKLIDWAIEKGMHQLLSVNMKALKGMLGNFEKAPEIPGVKISETKQVIITRSRV